MNSKYYSILYFSSLHEKYHIYPNARQSNLQQLPKASLPRENVFIQIKDPPPPKEPANKKIFYY
jgi:hypothetical protein